MKQDAVGFRTRREGVRNEASGEETLKEAAQEQCGAVFRKQAVSQGSRRETHACRTELLFGRSSVFRESGKVSSFGKPKKPSCAPQPVPLTLNKTTGTPHAATFAQNSKGRVLRDNQAPLLLSRWPTSSEVSRLSQALSPPLCQ